MEQKDLQQLVENISLKYFKKEFKHQAIFNKRLKTTGGRYLLTSHHIELNWTYYHHFGKEELIQVIKHELCHYHLHLEGKGYKHRDLDFKQLMKEVGAPRFCKSMSTKEQKNVVFRKYKCSNCEYIYYRKRRVNIMKYRCGKCKGKILEIY